MGSSIIVHMLEASLPWTPSVFLYFMSRRPRVCPRDEPSFSCCFLAQPATQMFCPLLTGLPHLLSADHALPCPLVTSSSAPPSSKPWLITKAPCHPCWPLHMITRKYCCHFSSTGNLSEPLGLWSPERLLLPCALSPRVSAQATFAEGQPALVPCTFSRSQACLLLVHLASQWHR